MKTSNSFFVKLMSVVLSTIMFIASLAIGAAAAAPKSDYIITNPYASVDWENWDAYKAQLHCHTNASDGYLTVKEVVKTCYDLNYDILAITDHGTLNRGWNKQPNLVPLVRLVKYERTKLAPIVPLTDDEYNYYLTGQGRNGRGMLDVPLGIELNMATPVADCHLTGYFAEYGQGYAGVYGDYETPAAEVNKLGGITMLSHVGEYVGSEYAPEKSSEPQYVNKFANIFIDNKGSCVGMGVNSATDDHTRHDRILYDNILKKTIPYGVVPWAFTFADAHDNGDYDYAYTMHMMPENTIDNFRESMVNGTFFSVSKFARYEIDADFVGEGPTPMVTNISVNDADGTISVEGKNFDNIVWIADGKTLDCDSTTIDLDNYEINYFTRFYLTGPGGICYAQPFVINKKGVEMKKESIPKTFDISTVLRKLVTILDNLIFKKSLLVKLFKKIALGY